MEKQELLAAIQKILAENNAATMTAVTKLIDDTLGGGNGTTEPTPEPTPTPTPTPTPSKYVNIPMGVNGHEGREVSYPKAQMEDRIKLLADNNLRHYRTDVDPNYLNNTSEFNRLIGLCQKYGVALRPMIYPTTEDNAYKFAKLYGDRVKIWEIGNEVDLQKPAGAPAIVDQMVATYKGMKRASDELKLGLKFVVNITATNTRDKANAAYGDANGPTWFLDLCVSKGFKFDYVSFHYYPRAYDSQSDWLDFYMGQVTAAAKRTGAKVFLNEFNAGEIYDKLYGNDGTYLASLRASLKALQKYKDVIEEITVYQLLDETNLAGPEGNFGLRTTLANKKAAWDVVVEFATATADSGTTTPAPTQPTAAKSGDEVLVAAIKGKLVTVTGKTLAKNQLVRFPNGRTTTVIEPITDGGLTFTTAEPAADTDEKRAALIGQTLKVVERDATPAPTPTPTPEPTPEKTKDVSVSLNLAVTGGDWDSGVWTASNVARVSIPTIDYLQVGISAKLGDGTTRKVQQIETFGDKQSITLEGTKLDASKVSAQPVVFVVPVSDIKNPPATTTPDPVDTTPPKDPTPVGTSVRKVVGDINFNAGMGAGADADAYIPGIYDRNYSFFTEAEAIRLKQYGAVCLRVGFLMGRVVVVAAQGKMYTGGNYTADNMLKVCEICDKVGLGIMWDNHVYGFSYGNGSSKKAQIGTANYGPDAFAMDWFTLISFLKANPVAWRVTKRFDLCNEPIYVRDAEWVKAVQAVINKCAPISEDKIFVIEGVNWASARSWLQSNPTLHTVTHPRGRQFLEFSCHLYLDKGADGYYDENGNQIVDSFDDVLSDDDKARGITFETVGTARFADFLAWLKKYDFNGNIGENIVIGNLPNLLKGERALLKMAIDNGVDVYLFGVSNWFGNSNPHNIEVTAATAAKVNNVPMFDNTNMLALAIEMSEYSRKRKLALAA